MHETHTPPVAQAALSKRGLHGRGEGFRDFLLLPPAEENRAQPADPASTRVLDI